MFRKPSRPLAKQLPALTSTVQSGAQQHRLLRWAWPAFTVAECVKPHETDLIGIEGASHQFDGPQNMPAPA